jgi:fructose 1,6-bisphosphate aldolase/phosphatase
MPVKLNSTISFFDGPAIVSGAGFCIHEGKFTEAVDLFDHPFWDWVRNNVSAKAAEIRAQGFSGPAMLPMSELEYGGVVEKMGQLDQRFMVRKEEHHAAAVNGGNGRKKKAA